MPLKEQILNLGKKLVEERPDPESLARFVQRRKPTSIMFADDGFVPNHPHFPLLFYRGVVELPRTKFDPATIIDEIFAHNGWRRSWRDTVYDFVHYHSQVHEVLGVARGHATIEFGGIRGRVMSVKPGDVAVLPAGTGHRLIKASRDFQVVGAYPKEGKYDECTDSRDRPEARKRIAGVHKPSNDPVYGIHGPLSKLWSRANRKR